MASADLPQARNLLMIVCDQLARAVISGYGSAWCATPGIDRLIARGTRFDLAYTPCPLSMPARCCLWTGCTPPRTGVLHNNRRAHVPMSVPTLGQVINGPHHKVHYGKTHDAGTLRGFHCVDHWHVQAADEPPSFKAHGGSRTDVYTTRRTVQALAAELPVDVPFLMVADLCNPHDICEWIGDHQGPFARELPDEQLPPLPSNFHRLDFDTRPTAVRDNGPQNFRMPQTRGWEPVHYRHYLAAYRSYVQRVDRDVAAILDGLDARADADRTLVVLLADHGEGLAEHGFVTKGGHFYESCTRVPFIMAGPGIARGAACDSSLVSLIDIMPTVAQALGYTPPDGIDGQSVWPLVTGSVGRLNRPAVRSWWRDGSTGSTGHMYRTLTHKYVRFDDAEELYDLRADPGEMKNLALLPSHRSLLEDHRQMHRREAQTNPPQA